MRILRSANALIANNPKLFEKRLWSDLGHGDTIRVTPAADDEGEAELVVHRLLAHKDHIHFGLSWRGARMRTTFWR